MRKLVSKNRYLLVKLVAVAVGMAVFAYLLVPLYRQICVVTGINQIQSADSVDNSQVDTKRTLHVELLATPRPEDPWQFRPLQAAIDVHPGALAEVYYEFENTSNRTVIIQAVPSYLPALAQRYFKKLECFCFKQQAVAAHTKVTWPVVFVVSRDVPQSIVTIVLSYSIFAVPGAQADAK